MGQDKRNTILSEEESEEIFGGWYLDEEKRDGELYDKTFTDFFEKLDSDEK